MATIGTRWIGRRLIEQCWKRGIIQVVSVDGDEHLRLVVTETAQRGFKSLPVLPRSFRQRESSDRR